MRKIFVACPAFLATGGTELLHQLVFSLKKYPQFQSFLFYCNYDRSKETPVIPAKFLRYISQEDVVDAIEDLPGNLFIVPEVVTALFTDYTAVKKCIWWLSVDNFFLAHKYPKISAIVNIRYRLKKAFNVKLKEYERIIFNENDVQYHLYQSEYARHFLTDRKIADISRLSDFLNDEFLEKRDGQPMVQKQDIVAYNPIKGFRFTKKLIRKGKNINWIAIENMTPAEVAKLLASAKVYIDFGYHPGKDRIPREAALNECIVITSKDGAAGNDTDIPIDRKYKFEKTVRNIQNIQNLIREVFKNYKVHNKNFDSYRNVIKKEKPEFEKDLVAFLRKTSFLP